MIFKKVCKYETLRHSAIQLRLSTTRSERGPILLLRALLAWKIGPAKFQCCTNFFWTFSIITKKSLLEKIYQKRIIKQNDLLMCHFISKVDLQYVLFYFSKYWRITGALFRLLLIKCCWTCLLLHSTLVCFMLPKKKKQNRRSYSVRV